jgi:hypothetical protein
MAVDRCAASRTTVCRLSAIASYQVNDGDSRKEERLNGQGDNQREEVIVVFVGVVSGIDTEGVQKNILIQSQPKY